mgnify:CR=1 FL=1
MDVINMDDLKKLIIKAKNKNDFNKLTIESPHKALDCALSINTGNLALEYAHENHLFEIIEYLGPYLSFEEAASLMDCYGNIILTIIGICDSKGIKTVQDCQKLYEKIIKEKESSQDE